MKKILLSTIAAFCFTAPVSAETVSNGQLHEFLDTYFNSATKSESTVKYFCGKENGYGFYEPTTYKILGYRGDDNGGYRVRVQVVARNTNRTLVGNVYEFSILKRQKFCINGFYLLPNELANP